MAVFRTSICKYLSPRLTKHLSESTNFNRGPWCVWWQRWSSCSNIVLWWDILPRQPLASWEPSNFNYTLWGSSTWLRQHRMLSVLRLLGLFWWANLGFSESSMCKCLSHWGSFSCILCDFEQIWPKTTLFFLTAPAGDGTNNFNILRGPLILLLIEMLRECPMMPHFP